MTDVTVYHTYVIRDPRNQQDVETTNPALIVHDLVRAHAERLNLKVDTDSFVSAADHCEQNSIEVSEFQITGDTLKDIETVVEGTPVKVEVADGVVSASFDKRRARKKLDT